MKNSKYCGRKFLLSKSCLIDIKKNNNDNFDIVINIVQQYNNIVNIKYNIVITVKI